MKKARYLSIKKQKKDKSNIGTDGKKVCRYCKGLIPSTRRTFCSNGCVHEWKLRSSNKYLRQNIYLRDLGICASCSIDTRFTKIGLENIQRELRERNTLSVKIRYQEFLKEHCITEKESSKSLWHADHIKPVIMGGGESGLDNIQTLCVKCHKQKTKLSYSVKCVKNQKV